MNVMVTLEMLRYVCDLWPDAIKEKDAVRARDPRRAGNARPCNA